MGRTRQPGFKLSFTTPCVRCGRDILAGQRAIPRKRGRYTEGYIHVGCASGQDE
jgi:hypothetical protein